MDLTALAIVGISSLVNLLAGASATWLVMRDQVRDARDRAELAEDRLYAAWKEDYAIPARPVEPEPVVIEPLPEMLQTLVNDWDSPDTRATLERAMRERMALGFGPKAIVRHYVEGKLDLKPTVEGLR